MVSNSNQYQQRLVKVLEFIDSHLDEALTVESLSGVAAFSKFHFHRQFSGIFEITINKYVQCVRLNRSAQQLVFRDTSIIDIALMCGYESPEAFSRAFKKLVGQTPSDFRFQPHWDSWSTTYKSIRDIRIKHMTANMQRQVNIVHTSDICVAALEHRGDPDMLVDSIRKFIEFRKQHQLHPSRHATFNILYVDPDTVPPEEYRLDLCLQTDMQFTSSREGIINKVIPGGRCAVLRHTGSDDLLRSSISYLYSSWLPESGEELRDFPLYVQRVKFFPDVPEHESIVDIFLPLK